MKYTLRKLDSTDYPELMLVWESSVKATHHFITREDFLFFKEMVPQYLGMVELLGLCDEDGAILGFMGTREQNLEMLFVSGLHRSKGVGKQLLLHGIDQLGITRVDVNEANEQAVRFYERFGFQTVRRSELDGLGKPYPILHMTLTEPII